MRHESQQTPQQSSSHSSSTSPQHQQRQRRRQHERPHARKSADVIKNIAVMDRGSGSFPPPPPPPGPPPTLSSEPPSQRQASQQQPHQQQSRQQQQKTSSINIDNYSSSKNVIFNASVATDVTRPCFRIPAQSSSGIVAFGWIDQHRRSKLCMVWKEVLATLFVRGKEEIELLVQRGVVIDESAVATGAVSENMVELHRIPMRWLVDVAYVDTHGDHRFVLKARNISEEFVFRTRDKQSAKSWVSKLVKTKLAGTPSNGEFTSMQMQMHQLNIHHEDEIYRDSCDHRDPQSQLSTNQPSSQRAQQNIASQSSMSPHPHMPSNNVNSIDNINGGCHAEPRISASWQQLSNPFDAASYLPNQEQQSYDDTRPHQLGQYMQQYRQQHRQNHSLQRQQSSPTSLSPPPLLTSTLTSSKYSYEWDPDNLNRFLSTRRAMLRAIFSTPNTNASIFSHNDDGKNIENDSINTIGGVGIEIGIGDSNSKMNKCKTNNSSTNFKSGGKNNNDVPFFITSPTRPADSKQYVEDGGGIDARSSINESRPLPPPPPPSLNMFHAPYADVDSGGEGDTMNIKQPQHKQLPLRKLPSKDYFGDAIRYLLIDTPLPLIGSCPLHNPPSESQPIPLRHHSVGNMDAALNIGNDDSSVKIGYSRSSNLSSSLEKKCADNSHRTNKEDVNHDGFTETTSTQSRLVQKFDSIGAAETIYLIPRYYLLGWTHWARCTILNASVESWFAAWENFDVQRGGVEGEKGRQEKRAYSILPEALKVLAALSILSEQYQLFIDTERDFISWMANLETCWATWNGQVREYHRHSSPSSQEEEVPQAFPNLTFPAFRSPGPVDSRILSTRHNPLLMHHHVALSMRGILLSYNAELAAGEDLYDENNVPICNAGSLVLSPAEDASESNLISFIDTTLWVPDDEYALATHSKQKLAVVPVPTSFYDMLRSVHGVICDDGELSFAPPLPYVNDVGERVEGMAHKKTTNGASVNCGGLLSSSCSLLFHDQWEECLDGQNHCSKQRINHLNSDIFGRYHRHYFTNVHHAKIDQTFRPIEFRRRLLPVPSADEVEEDEEIENSESYANIAAKGRSPYSTLMQEAIKSKRSYDAKEKKNRNGGSNVSSSGTAKNDTKNSVAGYMVEVFPVKFKYIIVGNDTGGDHSCLLGVHNPGQMHGIALGSRSSSAFAILRDIQRAAAPRHAHACVRLWKKSACHSATIKGDGYDLLDVTNLFAAPSVRSSCRGSGSGSDRGNDGSSKGSSPKSMKQSHKHQHQQQPSLTVEEWLGLEPLSIQNIDRHKRIFLSGEDEVVVKLLIEVRSSPATKWSREQLELENRLQVGDYVDAQDSAGKWYEAIVREIKPDTIKVHYFGWGSKWDAGLPRKNGSGSKLASPVPLWSRSGTWRDQIKVGDEVEIRESTSLVQRPKWHRATVLVVGEQNDVPRDLEGGAELELSGLNAAGKKVPLTLLNRKVQILVEVPQEMHNLPTSTPFKLRPEGIPDAQPPYRRWVNLYGEEICKANTHKTSVKKRSDLPVTLNYTLESKRDVVEVLKPYNNIHGSGFVRESLRGIPPSSGTVGLHNLGNSCYMNSILQCISHIKPITHFFLKGEYVKEINKMNPLGSGGRLATAYASFLADVYSGEYSILAPRLLKQTLCCFAPQFNNNYQHDSQEFCQYLMDGLHEDLNRVKSKPYVEEMEALGVKDSKAAMESWKKHLLRHDSIFVDYLQGMHRSHLTCPRCGKESIKFDVYSSISLPLVPAKEGSSIRLRDCLDQFAAGEQLDEHNAWYCSSCKRHVCALKLITLWNTPDVLILHLKRFTFEKCPIDGRILRRKIEDKVEFPIDRLDLSSYILGPKDLNAPPVYKLFGVSEHTGSTSNSGHYTATVRNSEDGNWYRYNDSHVGTTCEPAVTGGAYLLFYRRVKGSLRWAGMEKQMIDHDNRINLNTTQTEEDCDGFREVTGKKRRK